MAMLFFFSSRRRHTRLQGDWSSDVCSSDLPATSEASLRQDQLEALAGHVRVRVGVDQAGDDQLDLVRVGVDLVCLVGLRSEERRVGKECKSRCYANDNSDRRGKYDSVWSRL